MSTITAPMTVEEYKRLPEPPDGWYELHGGVLVKVSRPVHRYGLLGHNLFLLLYPLAKPFGAVHIEFPFRPLAEHEVRAADVAFIRRDRWDVIDPADYLLGAPDIVIEVLSPSNTAAKREEKRALCLGNGSAEFWMVDPARKTVTVHFREGGSKTYPENGSIPLALMGGALLPVERIFAA